MKKIAFLFIFSFFGCTNATYDDIIEPETNLLLKWNKGYEADSIEKSILGLQWAYSYIGALLPYQNHGIIQQNNFLEIAIEELGFTTATQKKLERLHEVIKSSEEYQVNNSVDLGRYVTLLLGAAEHYYEFTEVPKFLTDLLAGYDLNSERGFVNQSGVSFEHRIISFSDQNGFDQLFFCTEIDPNTQEILEYETVDLMPNGQPRFGIYNKEGVRINFTEPLHSSAGKPAKCIWCHESGIQPLFSKQNDVDGFIPYLDFKNLLDQFKETHQNLQQGLVDGVNYQETQQHSLTELLYITFMEPSAKRLSLEWNISVLEVEKLLTDFETHTQEEFVFLGDLYHRNEIDHLAPFSGLEISSDVREKSEVEVNYLD